jgi:hypothetical protein
MKFSSPRIKALMTLGVRPEGVSPRELAEKSTAEVTKTCQRLAREGMGTWTRTARLESRFFVTLEQHAEWLVLSAPKPRQKQKKKPASPFRKDGTPKDPRRVAAALKGYAPKPAVAVITTPKSYAQWPKDALARITSETKVTIWQPRTVADWIRDGNAA